MSAPKDASKGETSEPGSVSSALSLPSSVRSFHSPHTQFLARTKETKIRSVRGVVGVRWGSLADRVSERERRRVARRRQRGGEVEVKLGRQGRGRVRGRWTTHGGAGEGVSLSERGKKEKAEGKKRDLEVEGQNRREGGGGGARGLRGRAHLPSVSPSQVVLLFRRLASSQSRAHMFIRNSPASGVGLYLSKARRKRSVRRLVFVRESLLFQSSSSDSPFCARLVDATVTSS